MSSSYPERARGVTLRLLDFHAVAIVTAPDRVLSVPFAPFGMIEHNGILYVICAEGVGWQIRDDAPLSVDVLAHTAESVAIQTTLTLLPADVRACQTGETVDLADLIRRFGSRLEANFAIWHRELTRKAAKR